MATWQYYDLVVYAIACVTLVIPMMKGKPSSSRNASAVAHNSFPDCE